MSGQIEEFLRDEPDTGLHGLGGAVAQQPIALDGNVSRVGHHPARGDADQGRLSGSVLADDGENLALVNVDRDVGECLDAAVRLGDVHDVEERGGTAVPVSAGTTAVLPGGSPSLACLALLRLGVDQQV